jgi:hypothetical protein
VFDKTTKQFDQFTVSWDGVTMQFAASMDAGTGVSAADYIYRAITGKTDNLVSWSFDCEQNVIYPQPCAFYSSFDINGDGPYGFTGTFLNGNNNSGGRLFADPLRDPVRVEPEYVDETRLVATPEPSFWLLLVAGIGLLWIGLLRYPPKQPSAKKFVI